MMKRTAAAVCGAAVLAAGMTGCGAGFEGSGSKDAASAEQLAMRLDDPWAQEVQADQGAKAEGELADGVYTGTGKGMEGLVTVKLLVQDNRISCLETAQEGESQSRGGYEAVSYTHLDVYKRQARSSSSDSARRSARMDSLRLPTKLVSSLRNHECSVRERASNSEHVAARTNIHTDWRAPAACTM